MKIVFIVEVQPNLFRIIANFLDFLGLEYNKDKSVLYWMMVYQDKCSILPRRYWCGFLLQPSVIIVVIDY